MVIGLYFYDTNVLVRTISSSGELKITDVNRIYLEQGDFSVVMMARAMSSLISASMKA